MSILPVSNIINVTIENTPSGLTERNVNSLAIFTNDAPSNFDPYAIYVGASQVAADYGTNSKTALMANAVFAQNPNIRTGTGRLVVIPMLAAVSATAGKVTTADLTANLAAILAVTSGDLKVTIDSVAYNLTGLNFTEAVTWDDIATIIQAKLINGTVVSVGTPETGFKITSKKVGTASTVALAAVSGGTGTNLAGAGYFNSAGSTAVAGANSSGETIAAAIARTSGLVGYVPLMSTLDLEDAAVLAASNAVQALDNLYFQHFASTADIAGIITTIQQAGNKKTRCLLYTPGQSDANLYKAAYAGRGCSVNFKGSNTSQTMNLKQLATIDPDTGITQTLYDAAELAGADLYVSYDGVPSVLSSGGNDFFDNPYSDLALKFALETAGFDYLRQTNTKVPQTEPGMNGLKNAYAQVCQQFVTNGCVAPGQWTSSETFGNPGTFINNVLLAGYYIYSQPIAQQNSTDRDNRIAPLVQIAIKRAGAIHHSDVIVLVND